MAVIAAVILVIGGCVNLVSSAANADVESKQYVDVAIPAITAQWDRQQLETRLSPEFKSFTSAEQMDKMYEIFQKLGNLKTYNGCQGGANVSLTTGSGKVISARYIADAVFESGPAKIEIVLIKHGSAWQIAGFHVNSAVFVR